MVSPVTGPWTQVQTLNGPPTSLGFKPVWLRKERTFYWQKQPYNLPLPYRLNQRRIVRGGTEAASSYVSIDDIGSYDPVGAGVSDLMYNKAYAELTKQIKGESAQLVNSILERQKTLEMMYKRVKQLFDFTRAVKSFRWVEAAGILGLKVSKPRYEETQRKSRRKRRETRVFRNVGRRVVNLHNLRASASAFGDNWLEFHFGWKPLIGEIGRCVELLTGDYPRLQVRATRKDTFGFTEPPSDLGSIIRTVRYVGKVGWTVGCDVRIDNPAAAVADQLGLVNPASVVWEAVPFSFVVDWFGNVSEFLDSLDSFPGITLGNTFRTSYYLRVVDNRAVRKSDGVTTKWFVGEVLNVQRFSGLVGPTLRFSVPRALSPQRAATAVSLLLKLMDKRSTLYDRGRYVSR